jgi:hypothetical protein
MWVSLEAIGENFIGAGGGWSSGPLFIGKVFSPSSNFPSPKKELTLLHRCLVVHIE